MGELLYSEIQYHARALEILTRRSRELEEIDCSTDIQVFWIYLTVLPALANIKEIMDNLKKSSGALKRI